MTGVLVLVWSAFRMKIRVYRWNSNQFVTVTAVPFL